MPKIEEKSFLNKENKNNLNQDSNNSNVKKEISKMFNL